jgi:hypothetical protein
MANRKLDRLEFAMMYYQASSNFRILLASIGVGSLAIRGWSPARKPPDKGLSADDIC